MTVKSNTEKFYNSLSNKEHEIIFDMMYDLGVIKIGRIDKIYCACPLDDFSQASYYREMKEFLRKYKINHV